MKQVVLYYFSGTGNTEIVSNMIKDALSTRDCKVDVIRMEDVLKKNLKIDTVGYDLIGIGSQVTGFGVPNLVKSFLRAFPKGSGQKVFIFRTAGGVHPTNYNASKPIIRHLTQKSYDVFHERLFSIGSNWVVRFKDDIVRQLSYATNNKVNLMCDALLKGEKRMYKTGVGLRLRMGLIRILAAPVFRIVGKDYTVSKDCTNCGLCIKNCPSQNIHMKNGKIKFKLSCSCCMRCIYTCPQKAINLRLFKFFRVHGDYNIKEILGQEDHSTASVKAVTPPFFEKYLNNEDF